MPDQRVDSILGSDRWHAFEGPAGTVDFVDTSRCFHFGSRVSEGGTPRRVALFHYLTPYAFKYTDHRKQAPFRKLAEGADGELAQLVLGGA